MKLLRLVPVFALFGALLAAQTPMPDGLVSPEVNADRSVTFRVRAPKATEVTLYGDWMPVGQPQPMTRNDDGVWSLTTGLLEATGHLYWFYLDGLAVADPVNPAVKLRQRTSASLVEVPAPTPALWEIRDVPHGTIVTEWQRSEVLNRTERIVIYLPPGYEGGTTRYPILYLVHGAGDVPESWVQAGHANLILDNLIADGRTRPMIVVMPAGLAVPLGTGGAGRLGSAHGDQVRIANHELFEQYLVREVLPFVEGKYRVQAGAAHRALAGLSMGGGHTILAGFDHPELFSALGAFSPALPAEFDTRFNTVLTDAQSFNAKVGTLWIACGNEDSIVQFPRIKAWTEMLQHAGLRLTFRTYQGAHIWPVWRTSLVEFVPQLFPTGK